MVKSKTKTSHQLPAGNSHEFLELLPDAIVIVDTSGEIQYINKQTETLFGYNSDELVGEKIEILIPEQLRENHLKYRNDYLQKPEFRQMGGNNQDLTGLRKDGSNFSCEIMLGPVTPRKGNTCIICTIRDITERKAREKTSGITDTSFKHRVDTGQEYKNYHENLEEEVAKRTATLVKLNEELITAKKTEEELISTVSHDIRTPVNAVVGMVDLLSKTDISEEQLYYIDGLKSSSRHLLNIVNDLLDLKKIQARQLSLVNEPFDLNAILDSLREIFAFQASEKGIIFTIFKQQEVPVSLSGDSHRLEQILQNLLSNAIKFTDTGDIRLDITVDKLSENDIRLSFTVSDTGIGIPEEKLDKVFESFYQAHDFKKDKLGSGLGLAIVKALVELQEGEVFVKSLPEKGSTFGFYITYPLIAETLTEEEQEEVTIQLTGKDKPLNILVADDEEVNIFIAKRYLETSGIEVVVDTANNGKAVIDRINEKGYDMIIMDLRMPYMSGYEVAVFIRDKFPAPKSKTPILLLTASTLADDDPCLKYINDYLLKPFQREDLYGKIQEIIK